MTAFLTINAVSGQLSYTKRALDDFNSSGPQPSDQSLLLAIGLLFIVGLASAWGVWMYLRNHKQNP